jgi:tRNA nucleotidyltransferase (CCA-adding enzyme)
MSGDLEATRRLAAALPAHVRTVCQTLAGAGHQAVAVGGAVRDALLGREPGDWDVATSARPEQVMTLFRHTVPTGLQHGTVTIVTGRGEASHVEVTTFRGEGAYTDARRPDHVTFGVPLVDDLARRDLRVNAMAYDPATGTLIDPYDGRADIAARCLRAVGPTGNVYDDAVARFSEDGLRVMRAVRFAAQLEFALDPDTERGIVPALPSLAKVSKERISEELRKILAAREPSRALATAERVGILALILPELVAGFDAWSRALGGERSAVVARWLARIDAAAPAARLGALIAEVAAPPSSGAASRRVDRHAVRAAEAVLRRLKFSNDEAAVASVLAGTVAAAAQAEWADPDLRRLLADITRHHATAAVALWHADEVARGAGASGLGRRAGAILERKEPLAVNELAVTGKDLLIALDMLPGPALGRLLAVLLERVLVDPSLNTRDSLIELARHLVLELPPA